MSIQYLTGDATYPVGSGRKIIIHVCNDMGGWGSGFVLAVSKRWKEPERSYRDWTQICAVDGNRLPLGEVQFVDVGDGIILGNMIAQHNTFWENGVPPIRYQSLAEALDSVAHYALMHNCSVHGPRFGSALAGGEWHRIESMIETQLIAKGIDVIIYDFPDAESFADEIERRKGEAEIFKEIM